MNESPTDLLERTLSGDGCIVSVAGPDGSGKSTLIGALRDVAAEARVDAVRIHSFRWHSNVFVMPFRLRALKRSGKLVLLDRCVFDNVVELALNRSLSRPARRALMKLLAMVYIDFDVKILLRAPADVLAARRPDESPDRTRRQIALYAELLSDVGYRSLDSTQPTLPLALSEIRRAMER